MRKTPVQHKVTRKTKSGKTITYKRGKGGKNIGRRHEGNEYDEEGKPIGSKKGLLSFTDFLKGAKLSYPNSGWDEEGNALIDIELRVPSVGFVYKVSKAKVDDYVTNRKLPLGFQVKEKIYSLYKKGK